MKRSEYELVAKPSPDGHTPCQNCIFDGSSLKNPIRRGTPSQCIVSILEFRTIGKPEEFGKMKDFSCLGTEHVIVLAHRISGQVLDPKDIVELYRDDLNEEV